MQNSCRDFRDDWLVNAPNDASLEAVEGESAHLPTCSECRTWVEVRRRQVELLAALSRLGVPDEVEGGVRGELGETLERVVRALRELPRETAPTELDVRVAAELSDVPEADHGRATGRDSRASAERAQIVRTLDISTVPSVLERLVEEELQAPKVHLAERFLGNMEPVRAPDALARRIERSLGRRPVLRWLAPLAGVAAAGLVLWLSLFRDEEPGDELAQRRSFRVVRADSLDALDPFARGLAEVLGGGVPAPPASEDPETMGGGR